MTSNAAVATKTRTRAPQVLQVVSGKPVNHVQHTLNQIKPHLEKALKEASMSPETFYTGSFQFRSNSTEVKRSFVREDRDSFDYRGASLEPCLEQHISAIALDQALERAMISLAGWINSILSRLKDERGVSSIELIIMIRREQGDRMARIYARKEVLNCKVD